MNSSFWRGKKVFLTGHTGFKGAWLSLWLASLGAEVTGYALEPPTEPNMFGLCHVDGSMRSIHGDVRDREHLRTCLLSCKPDIVMHMAAQSLVREAYVCPVETYGINVMGTVHLLDAVRRCASVRAVLNITTDKCYENREWFWGYREIEPLGGFDPYSNSKACSELVTAAYRNSFFPPERHAEHGVAVASARAGNVIGGGDWAKDRLIPDCIRSLLKGEKIKIRSPHALRPWQYVLEPLNGYLTLAQRLYEQGPTFAEAWNFGPEDKDAKTVEWIVKFLCKVWGKGAALEIDQGDHPHESQYLKLDWSKAKTRLGWYPRWNIEKTLHKILEWTDIYRNNGDLKAISLRQIYEYMNDDN